MNNKLIILGGMGPQASLKLHEHLIAMSNASQPDEYPEIIHASIPVPDFISSSDKISLAVDRIQNTCKQLPLENASIGMACNTAHLLLDQLTSIPKSQFISMIESVGDDLSATGMTKIGLLASPTTIKSKLYHDEIESRGMTVIQPSEDDLRQLEQIIRDVIGGTPVATLRPKLTAIANKLEQRGAQVILLGCTELPLVGIDSNLVAIDSLSSLAKRMLKKHVVLT